TSPSWAHFPSRSCLPSVPAPRRADSPRSRWPRSGPSPWSRRSAPRPTTGSTTASPRSATSAWPRRWRSCRWPSLPRRTGLSAACGGGSSSAPWRRCRRWPWRRATRPRAGRSTSPSTRSSPGRSTGSRERRRWRCARASPGRSRSAAPSSGRRSCPRGRRRRVRGSANRSGTWLEPARHTARAHARPGRARDRVHAALRGPDPARGRVLPAAGARAPRPGAGVRARRRGSLGAGRAAPRHARLHLVADQHPAHALHGLRHRDPLLHRDGLLPVPGLRLLSRLRAGSRRRRPRHGLGDRRGLPLRRPALRDPVSQPRPLRLLRPPAALGRRVPALLAVPERLGGRRGRWPDDRSLRRRPAAGPAGARGRARAGARHRRPPRRRLARLPRPARDAPSGDSRGRGSGHDRAGGGRGRRDRRRGAIARRRRDRLALRAMSTHRNAGAQVRRRRASARASEPAARHERSGAPVTVDELDRALIQALWRDGRTSNRALAKALGVSEATIASRLARLEEAAITRVVALVDMEAFGYEYLAFAKVRVGGRRLADVAQDLTELQESISVTITTGRFDLIVGLLARDRAHLADLLGITVPAVRGVEDVACELGVEVLKYESRWSQLGGAPRPVE